MGVDHEHEQILEVLREVGLRPHFQSLLTLLERISLVQVVTVFGLHQRIGDDRAAWAVWVHNLDVEEERRILAEAGISEQFLYVFELERGDEHAGARSYLLADVVRTHLFG